MSIEEVLAPETKVADLHDSVAFHRQLIVEKTCFSFGKTVTALNALVTVEKSEHPWSEVLGVAAYLLERETAAGLGTISTLLRIPIPKVADTLQKMSERALSIEAKENFIRTRIKQVAAEARRAFEKNEPLRPSGPGAVERRPIQIQAVMPVLEPQLIVDTVVSLVEPTGIRREDILGENTNTFSEVVRVRDSLVFLLTAFTKLSYAEIGPLVGRSTSNIGMSFARAMQRREKKGLSPLLVAACQKLQVDTHQLNVWKGRKLGPRVK